MAFGRALVGAGKGAVMPGRGQSAGGMGAIKQKLGLGPQMQPPGMKSPELMAMKQQQMAQLAGNAGNAVNAAFGRRPPPMNNMMQGPPPEMMQQSDQMAGPAVIPQMNRGNMLGPGNMMSTQDDPMKMKMQQMMQQGRGIGPSPKMMGGGPQIY